MTLSGHTILFLQSLRFAMHDIVLVNLNLCEQLGVNFLLQSRAVFTELKEVKKTKN